MTATWALEQMHPSRDLESPLALSRSLPMYGVLRWDIVIFVIPSRGVLGFSVSRECIDGAESKAWLRPRPKLTIMEAGGDSDSGSKGAKLEDGRARLA